MLSRLRLVGGVWVLFQVSALVGLVSDSAVAGEKAERAAAGARPSGASGAMMSCVGDMDCEDEDVCTWDRCVEGFCEFVPNLYGDVDHNDLLNVFDVLRMLECMMGECPPEQFEAADIDPCEPNGLVNVLDVFAMIDHIGGVDPCCGASPRVSEYSNSGCLPAPISYPDCGEDAIEYRVDNVDVYVAHRNASYNCCPGNLVISVVEFEPGRLRLWEQETLPQCFCMCCYDILAVVVDLPPGPWEIEFCWEDWETRGVRCDVQFVVIE